MNDDKSQISEGGRDKSPYSVSRRGFLKGVGSGIVILLSLGELPRGWARG